MSKLCSIDGCEGERYKQFDKCMIHLTVPYKDDDGNDVKLCKRCNRIKHLDEFKNALHPDKYITICKRCNELQLKIC